MVKSNGTGPTEWQLAYSLRGSFLGTKIARVQRSAADSEILEDPPTSFLFLYDKLFVQVVFSALAALCSCESEAKPNASKRGVAFGVPVGWPSPYSPYGAGGWPAPGAAGWPVPGAGGWPLAAELPAITNQITGGGPYGDPSADLSFAKNAAHSAAIQSAHAIHAAEVTAALQAAKEASAAAAAAQQRVQAAKEQVLIQQKIAAAKEAAAAAAIQRSEAAAATAAAIQRSEAATAAIHRQEAATAAAAAIQRSEAAAAAAAAIQRSQAAAHAIHKTAAKAAAAQAALNHAAAAASAAAASRPSADWSPWG